MLGTHFQLAALGATVELLVVAIVGAVILAIILVAGILGFLRQRLGFGIELEILEQTPSHFAERALVVDCQRQRVEFLARLRLDPLGDQFQPRLGRTRRRCAGQSLSGDQADRGRQRHLVFGPRPPDRVGPDPRLHLMAQIGAHPGHCPRSQRLDPRGLERIEHRPRLDIERRDRLVERLVVEAQPQCRRIRRPARFSDQSRLEPRPRRHHPRDLARCAADIAREHHIGLAVMGDRARCAGEGAAETVEGGCGHDVAFDVPPRLLQVNAVRGLNFLLMMRGLRCGGSNGVS